MNNNQNNEFLNWGEGFIAQENEFVLLDEGVYAFTVTKMDKKVYSGNSTKIPNGCPYAELNIQVQSQKGTANIKERLYLLKSMQWKLTQFFAGIGQPVVTGQAFNPNWNAVVGSTGRAEIIQHSYTNQNGDNRTNNQIQRYLKPTDPTPAVNATQQDATQQGHQPQQNFNGGQGTNGGQPGAF